MSETLEIYLRQLRLTLSKMELGLGSIDESILWTNQKGEIEWCNRSFDKLLGLRHIDVLGREIFDLLPLEKDGILLKPEDHPASMALRRKREINDLYQSCESKAFLHVTAKRLPLPEAENYAILTVRDVSESMELHKIRLQSIALQSAANAIVITDRNGNVEWVNRAFSDMTGYSSENICNRNIKVLKSDENDPAIYRNLWETITTGKVWSGRLVNLKKDGSRYTEEQTITPVLDKNGEIGHFIAIKQDITERESIRKALDKSNKQLRLEEAELRAILENAVDGIIIAGQEGIIQRLNPAAERLFGYSRENLVGKNVSLLMPEPHASRHDEYIARYLQTGEKRVIGIGRQVMGRRRDGTLVPLDFSVSEAKIEDRHIFISLLRDITERKRAEEKIGEVVLQLERHREDMLSILNRLQLGVVMLDSAGRVTFLSRTCESMLDIRLADLKTSDWDSVWPFSQADKDKVQRLFELQESERHKITLHVPGVDNRSRRFDVEVHDDPRDPRAKILFMNDISEIYELRHQLEEKSRYMDIVGKSEPMQRVFAQIRQLSQVDSTVLIVGETGTGKELVASALHQSSPRSNRPFIPINCAGLSESLIASQLFGHKKGAFTGAIKDQEGVFEAAHGGTLFLDEIGDIPMNTQSHLLRVLQEKEIVRLGESKPRTVDVRVVAATNRTLEREISAGHFRSDLYYRIHVASIHLPPLRERKTDIPLLIRSFLDRSNAFLGKKVEGVSEESMKAIMSYSWPGNIRELQNVIEASAIQCNERILGIEHLPPEVLGSSEKIPEETVMSFQGYGKDELIRVLNETRGNLAAAARLLGIGRSTLYRRMKKYGFRRS